MDKALQETARPSDSNAAPGRSWGSRMSDHVAYALLTYTGLQIFVTMLVLKTNHSSILPYFALVILVGAIIPACRLFEMRWSELPELRQHDRRLAGAFARDRALLWVTAIVAPFAITGFIKAASLLFA